MGEDNKATTSSGGGRGLALVIADADIDDEMWEGVDVVNEELGSAGAADAVEAIPV